jgi:hypothetical protein
LAQDLPADVPPRTSPTDGPATPVRRAASVIHQFQATFAREPAPGHCHLVDMDVTADLKGQKPMQNHLRLVRGSAGRFTLTCRLPVVGEVTMGQKDFPWMVTAGNSVLMGVKNRVENRDPLSLADPRHLARLRVLAGLVETLDLVPEVLDQWVAVEEAKASDGTPAVRVAAREKVSAKFLVSFQPDGKTPKEALFDVSGATGKAIVRDWRLDAATEETAFHPPANLPVKEMDQADLYRMFATLLGLLMQQAR